MPTKPHSPQIAAVTLTAPDLDTMERAYVEALGQRPLGRIRLDEELAASWDCAGLVGKEMALLEPPSGAGGVLRWVASEPWPAGTRPRTTVGWAALELTVADVEGLHRRLAADGRFRVLGPPSPLPGLPQICPMQVEGPAGEVLFLNEVRGDLPDHDLPRAACDVDRVFIVVLAAADLERAVDFYADSLGLEPADRYEIPYGAINHAFGLPAATKHRLATLGVGRTVCLEVDQYPEAAGPRPRVAGSLPPAMAMVSLTVEALTPSHRERALGPVVRRAEPPYLGRRALTVRGPAGEWIELIEA